MDLPETVPASEFTRNFGRYRMRAQRQVVAVSSHGQITGYFVGPETYEEFRRFQESRHSFATAELPGDKVEAIAASRMDPQHDHLDALLDHERVIIQRWELRIPGMAAEPILRKPDIRK